jgi:hypothetical protein
MFPPPDSVIGQQVDEFGLEVLPITGSMLNIAMNDRIVAGARPEAFPFKLALSLRGRVAFARAGLKVRKAVAEHEAAVARRPGDTEATIRLRSMQAGGDTSFGDYLGPLHPEAERIFQALCNRSSGDLDSITQASMATLFAHVWDSGDLGRNMRGGSGLLPEALGRDLAAHIRLHTAATRVTFAGSGVDIDYVGPDGAGTVRARTVILAIPAPFIPALLGDALPSDTATALDRDRWPCRAGTDGRRRSTPAPHDPRRTTPTPRHRRPACRWGDASRWPAPRCRTQWRAVRRRRRPPCATATTTPSPARATGPCRWWRDRSGSCCA